MIYLDKTFCNSPNCINDCGRKMTEEEKAGMPCDAWVYYAYFCGVQEQVAITDDYALGRET